MTFTNTELSICLEVLYAPSRHKAFECKNVERIDRYRDGIEIIGAVSDMEKVLCKIKSLELTLWTNSEPSNVPSSKIDYFYSSNTERTRITFTNENAVKVFKDAVKNDLHLESNVSALNSYTIKSEYKRSML